MGRIWRAMLCIAIGVGATLMGGLHEVEARQAVVANIVPSGDAKSVIHELNYQGWLSRASDTTAISDTVTMTFRIYNVPTGGIALWTETHPNVQVDKGIFNILLGSISALPGSIFTGTALWIETQAGTDVLLPRKKLVSVGYAIKAEKADTANIANYVAGANVSGEVANANRADTAQYAVTTNVNYVDSARITTNSYRWNNNLWGVDYPKSDKSDTALFITGANVSGEVAQANRADTADYAPSTPDSNWTRSGNRVYTFNTTDSVGIGTTNPGAKLDVAGRIWQTGTGQSVFLGEGAGNSDDLSNNSNVFVGYRAGYSNTTGYSNTFSGYYAGSSNTTGNYNTAVGYNATPTAGGYVNTTGLGYNAQPSGSNRVHIGNSSVSWIGGQVAWSTYSDKRAKTNVRQDIPGLSFITKLEPVSFNWDVNKLNTLKGVNDTAQYEGKYDIEKIRMSGFLAQDVEKVANECGYDFSGIDSTGGVYSLKYEQFVVPLVKAVQEQHKMIENQQNEIKNQQKEIKNQQKEIEELKQEMAKLKK